MPMARTMPLIMRDVGLGNVLNVIICDNHLDDLLLLLLLGDVSTNLPVDCGVLGRLSDLLGDEMDHDCDFVLVEKAEKGNWPQVNVSPQVTAAQVGLLGPL